MEFPVSRHFNIKFYNFLTINYNANPQPIDGGSVWKMEGPNPQHPMFRASANYANYNCNCSNTNVLSKSGGA